MLTAIKGIYDNGKIIFTEEPTLIETKADVIVTFLPERKNAVEKSKRISGGLEGKISVPGNFNEPLEEVN